jgi:hypothetical protein
MNNVDNYLKNLNEKISFAGLKREYHETRKKKYSISSL